MKNRDFRKQIIKSYCEDNLLRETVDSLLTTNLKERNLLLTNKDSEILKRIDHSIYTAYYKLKLEYKYIHNFYNSYSHINCVYFSNNENFDLNSIDELISNAYSNLFETLYRITFTTIYQNYYNNINSQYVRCPKNLFDLSSIENIFLVNSNIIPNTYYLILWFNISGFIFLDDYSNKTHNAFSRIFIDDKVNLLNKDVDISIFVPLQI